MNPPEFILKGYEDLEISTQILLRDAMEREIDVQVIDRKSNFLRLSRNNRTEYVKQATKTSKDTCICSLIMENKSVSRQVLRENGLPVPWGRSFCDPEAAFEFCRDNPDRKTVVKPARKSSGIGVTILDERRTEFAIRSAVSQAFSFAKTVIVEEFVQGEKFRFLVVDFDTVAVCKRQPANVCGDGVSNIEKLIAEKNQDPRRGKEYTAPLGKIVLGQTEFNVLYEDYGYLPDAVPGDGEVVYLRRNSNICSGGDTIDATDAANLYYKDMAEKAARSVNASICGVDMILPDIESKGEYAILELDFSPALCMHNYPYQGKNRQVGKKILDLLGFSD